jgi:hypothetical protein
MSLLVTVRNGEMQGVRRNEIVEVAWILRSRHRAEL